MTEQRNIDEDGNVVVVSPYDPATVESLEELRVMFGFVQDHLRRAVQAVKEARLTHERLTSEHKKLLAAYDALRKSWEKLKSGRQAATEE